MAVKRAELAEAILSLLDAKGGNRSSVAESVAAFMVDERRTKELNTLLRDLEELHYKKDGVLEVSATSVRPLTDDARQKIKQLFEAKEVKIYEQIDPELLGGVRVRALDKAADFSVQARLRRLRQGTGRNEGFREK